MKTSILICATCFIVTGSMAQFRFPSLSSALSSLTGFGSNGGASASSSSNSQSGQSASPYSGLVRDYGRNLMMAMSSIYPTLFRPPQQQQQAAPSNQQVSQTPFDSTFGASQYGSQNLFPSQSAPSFSFGGSTFSISPSLPFGSLSGSGGSQSAQPSGGSHSPFSASFGSSINSPPSFGPLSSDPFSQNSMPSFAPVSSYKAAFDAANGNSPSGSAAPPSFGNINSAPGLQSASGLSNQLLMPQSSNSNPMSSYAPIPSYNQHDSAASSLMGQQHQSHQPMNQPSGHGSISPSHQHSQAASQHAPQQYRPDMMSIAASVPVPSSNSYSNYGIPSGQQAQQGPSVPSSYQQPAYR